MARGAILGSVDSPVMHEFFSQLQLLFRSNLKIEIVDILWMPNLQFRVAMAIQAKRHAQRFCVINLIHFVDGSVTLHTTDAPIHVNRMVEIDIVRRFMDLNPWNRFPRLSAVPHQCQLRIVFQNLIMAIHAGRCAGNIGIPGFLHAVMAITAVKAELARVNTMRKRHRLDRLITNARVFRGEIIGKARGDAAANQQGANKNFRGKPIRPLGKNV